MAKNTKINIKTDIPYRWSERGYDESINDCVLASDDLWYLAVLGELAADISEVTGDPVISDQDLVNFYNDATGISSEWEEEGDENETEF